jgi:hypothetical protein
VLVLDDLEPAKKVQAPSHFRPGLEFDGNEGTATTEGLPEAPNFDEFLEERGYSPDEYEIVGTPRTSQWQRWDGEWLTAYRFHFRKKLAGIHLPTLYAEAKRTRVKPAKQKKSNSRTFVICPADFQIGKGGSRGGHEESIQRIHASYARIEEKLKIGTYDHIIILDMGDIIEGVNNKADMDQLQSNTLSPMQQVDLSAALIWDLIKIAAKYAPLTYGSVASNHCQFRVNKAAVGRPGTDDWGVVILQQIRRLATEVGLPVERWLVPQPHEEGFAFDVFDDGSHILGAIHGHQVARPDGFQGFWSKAVFNDSYLAAATLMVSGHFHHHRVEQFSGTEGRERWWVQASTMDNGSDWYTRTQGAGGDCTPALTCFELEKGVPFRGKVELL